MINVLDYNISIKQGVHVHCFQIFIGDFKSPYLNVMRRHNRKCTQFTQRVMGWIHIGDLGKKYDPLNQHGGKKTRWGVDPPIWTLYLS